MSDAAQAADTRPPRERAADGLVHAARREGETLCGKRLTAEQRFELVHGAIIDCPACLRVLGAPVPV